MGATAAAAANRQAAGGGGGACLLDKVCQRLVALLRVLGQLQLGKGRGHLLGRGLERHVHDGLGVWEDAGLIHLLWTEARLGGEERGQRGAVGRRVVPGVGASCS